ncbi:MAG: hypothetical protein IT270_04835 [Saprospiraceae bacterium]|nr:hypothetical protein [Saprospiraceae bacterium]
MVPEVAKEDGAVLEMATDFAQLTLPESHGCTSGNAAFTPQRTNGIYAASKKRTNGAFTPI